MKIKVYDAAIQSEITVFTRNMGYGNYAVMERLASGTVRSVKKLCTRHNVEDRAQAYADKIRARNIDFRMHLEDKEI